MNRVEKSRGDGIRQQNYWGNTSQTHPDGKRKAVSPLCTLVRSSLGRLSNGVRAPGLALKQRSVEFVLSSCFTFDPMHIRIHWGVYLCLGMFSPCHHSWCTFTTFIHVLISSSTHPGRLVCFSHLGLRGMTFMSSESLVPQPAGTVLSVSKDTNPFTVLYPHSVFSVKW